MHGLVSSGEVRMRIAPGLYSLRQDEGGHVHAFLVDDGGLAPHVQCPVDRALKDGDHVGPLEILGVPGHTPGCLAFYWRDKSTVIAGDIVVTWPEVAPGWPGLTLDNDQNLKSVGKLADAITSEILCVGHGEPITTGGSDVLRKLRDGKKVQL